MDIQEIKGFLNSEGKVTQIPGKRRKKLAVLYYLAEQIPAGRTFSEREFNELLGTLHTFGDPATLRREMYDYYLIHRSTRGDSYWANEEKPTLEELFDRFCR